MSKTNVIKFVTDDAYIYDHKPMAPSLKYAPEWWKKLPRHFVSQRENDNVCLLYTSPSPRDRG